MGYTALILLAILVILDFIACRRILRSSAGKYSKSILSASIILSDIIIFTTPIFMFLFTDGNNNGSMTKVIMSVITLFILFAVAKISLYIYWLPSKGKKLLYAGLMTTVAVSSFYLYSVFVTRTDYEVKEVDICFENLPDSFEGYRIVFISDIHLGTMYDSGKELEKLVAVMETIDADILMFGGDLVNMNYREITPEALHYLSKMRYKEPTIAVLGNHDTGVYMFDTINSPLDVNIGNIKERIESAGWRLLMDSTVYLYKGNDSIAVTGIDYNKTLLEYRHSFENASYSAVNDIYSSLDKDVFNITVSHLPQLWNELSGNGYSDLTLSGHIHSMQFKLNIFGYEFSPARFMYKEWSGLYENGNGKLYINDGIGNVGFFARIGARPEVTVINLCR